MPGSSFLSSPVRRWLQWRSLHSRDRRALFFFAAMLPAVDASLRLLGYRRTCRLLDAFSRHDVYRHPNRDESEHAERLAQLALVAGRRGAVHASCLRQALALNFLLRKKGLASEVRLGIAPPDGNGFNAHAWVELDGIALGEQGQPSHLMFKRA